MGEIRGVMGTPPIHKGLQKTTSQPQQQQQRLRLPTASSVGRQQSHNGSRNGRLLEPVLSPILTDQELSPLHRTHPDYLTDQSESENEEDQATQGYSEGLADNEQDEEESEVSSLFGGQDLENLGSPHLSSYPGKPVVNFATFYERLLKPIAFQHKLLVILLSYERKLIEKC